MAGQSESSTQLNTGSGGDLVRDLTITPPKTGTTVKQQVVSIGDPVAGDNLAAISIDGALYVRADDLIGMNRSILIELRRISEILGELADYHPDNSEINSEDIPQ